MGAAPVHLTHEACTGGLEDTADPSQRHGVELAALHAGHRILADVRLRGQVVLAPASSSSNEQEEATDRGIVHGEHHPIPDHPPIISSVGCHKPLASPAVSKGFEL